MASKKSLTLTLVIPVYNEESYLEDCLQAVAEQTHKPYEVIVVDNNSTDSTQAICKSFSFVTIITEKQQGIVFARNAGFNRARGDIIGRIDADTILPADWVSRCITLAQQLPLTDGVTGPCTFRSAIIPSLDFAFHRVVYFWFSRLLFGHQILFGSNMFIFRKEWLKVRYKVCLTNNVHEDMDLSHHIVQDGGMIHFQGDLVANISNRRFHNWGRYPFMWLYSRLIHMS